MSPIVTPDVLVEMAGPLLVLALALPVLGMLVGPVLGARALRLVALLSFPLGLAVALGIGAALMAKGAPIVYKLGGWAPPLGVVLEADGPSVAMLVLSALILTGVGLYAAGDFRVQPGGAENRGAFAFWTLLLGVWGGLNAIFLGRDLFNLYVALELLTFSAVPLVSLKGGRGQLSAALRYLLFALLGSVLYLLGAALLYGLHGTLDIPQLAQRLADPQTSGTPAWASLAALALMTVGLLAKTALVPLHLWLPPAHAGAPAPASAVLSALVVKGSFFLTVRLWMDLAPGLTELPAAQVLGALGAAAILLGNLWALTQERLKLLVAYSTVAQIGYLFLIFPLAVGESSGLALAAGIVQAISHACAKAAMFLAAGLIAVALGHDRLRDLGGLGRAMPLTVLGLALAGLALAGLQPSGGYVVKSLIQTAALETGQWWWGPVLDLGGLLTAAYLARVLGLALGPALAPTLGTGVRVAEVPGIVERPRPVQVTVVLLLALCALLLGLLPPDLVAVLGLGREGPDASQAVGAAMGGAFDSGSLWSSLGPMLAVALVVLIWGGRGSLAGVLARPLTWLDGGLRQWRVAGLALLILTLALAGGLIGGSLGHA